MVLLIEQADCLKVFVDPDWRAAVQSTDIEYIDGILSDFTDRAASDPKTLFAQTSSLSVGPLLTHETGSFLTDNLRCSNLLGRFVELR